MKAYLYRAVAGGALWSSAPLRHYCTGWESRVALHMLVLGCATPFAGHIAHLPIRPNRCVSITLNRLGHDGWLVT